MASSLRVKWPGHEADHLRQSDAGVKNDYGCISTACTLEYLDIYVWGHEVMTWSLDRL